MAERLVRPLVRLAVDRPALERPRVLARDRLVVERDRDVRRVVFGIVLRRRLVVIRPRAELIRLRLRELVLEDNRVFISVC